MVYTLGMNAAGNLQADVIVVGSGPGGATAARELARLGRSVLLLERGRDHRGKWYYGTYLGALRYTDRSSLLFTREGMNIIRPLMVGGATSMFCGCAAPPPDWLASKYGIDLSVEVSETIEELEIAPLAGEQRGAASTRLAQAGRALGGDWQPLAKFMRPQRSPDFDCGAQCMLGCRCQAKWNAGEYVSEAVQYGARLLTGARVEQITSQGGQVTGVRGRMNGRPFAARAAQVIVSAGGIGSARLLQNSGFEQAGEGITMDSTVIVYGAGRQPGIGSDPPMTWYAEDTALGVMYSTLIDPWLLYPLINSLKGLRYPLTWPRWNRTMGVMIKLKDELSGGIYADGTISKPITPSDRERLAEAEAASRAVLLEAGADPESLFTSPLRGTHPSSTVRIGHLVDQHLQMEVHGLYVCDASVFPEALGRPTVLTIIALAKRLARRLAAGSAASSQSA